MDRGALDVDTLIKIVLLLVIFWLVLEVLETVLGLLRGVFWFLQPLLAVVVLILLILWLVDRI